MSIDIASFSTLDSATKIQLICKLSESCDLQELKSIQEEINNLLKRDFFSLLPPELAEVIISYLALSDIINCLLVSKQWNCVLTTCNPVWKKYCKKYGLSGNILIEQASRFPTLKDLAVSTMRLCNICSAKRRSYTLDEDTNMVLHYISRSEDSVLRDLAMVCIQHKYDQIVLSRAYVCAPGFEGLEEVASLPVISYQSKVIWCSLTMKHLIIYTSDGTWLRITEACSDWHATGTWTDDIYNAIFFRFAACPYCSLIMVADVHNVDSQWRVKLIRLPGESSSGDEIKVAQKTFTFLPFEKSPVFRIKKIALLPSMSHNHNHDCCQSHRVVFQMASGIALFALDLNASEFILTGPVWNTTIDRFHSLDYSGGFCLSADGKLIALCDSNGLYIWDLDKRELFRHCKTLELSECFSVGYLFAFLGDLHSHYTYVMSIQTGEHLLVRVSRCFNGVFSLLATQKWLSYIPASVEETKIAIIEYDSKLSPHITPLVHSQ